MSGNRIVTCTAPVNIAVIKYWGKRNEELILPLNDSISFTLSQDEMCAKTTIVLSSKFMKDRFWLNGKEEVVDNPRILNCLREVRRLAGKRKFGNDDSLVFNWHVHIYSINNFPTAAGLASSAAGYACLVYALGQLHELDYELSSVARLGSGSACRSLYGGLVRWHKGSDPTGIDSLATQILPQDHFKDVHVIICVANDGKKKTASTNGMQRSVDTSELMTHRINHSVPSRIEKLLKSVHMEDWSTFCDLTIADSNEMHAVCLDTFPPCVYMNDTSHAVARLIHAFNKYKENLELLQQKVCYTFDAGPNACLFVPSSSVDELCAFLNFALNCEDSSTYKEPPFWRGIPINEKGSISQDLHEILNQHQQNYHSIKYFIHTKVGGGPKLLEDGPHLLDVENGLPLSGCSKSDTISNQEGDCKVLDLSQCDHRGDTNPTETVTPVGS